MLAEYIFLFTFVADRNNKSKSKDTGKL